MKILYFLRYWPVLSQTFIDREMAGLLERGHDVRALAWGRLPPAPGPFPAERVGAFPPGLYPRAVAALLRFGVGSPRRVVEALGWGVRFQRLKDLLKATLLAEQARRGGVDVVVVPFASEAAELVCAASMLSGLPWVCTVHAAELYVPRPSLPSLLGRASRVLTVTHHQVGLLRERGVEAHLVRCGVEWAPPAPQPPSPVGLTVARLIPKKGLDVLLAALASLAPRWPGLRWEIVGEGPEGPGLRERARGLGLAEVVCWRGALPFSEVEGLYHQGASLFVLPCRVDERGDRDGLPVALLEAMVRGVPVVSSHLPGIDELIEDGVTGLLTPPGDATALAQAIERLLVDGQAAALLGRGGRERVLEGHLAPRWAAELERVLAEVVCSPGLNIPGASTI